MQIILFGAIILGILIYLANQQNEQQEPSRILLMMLYGLVAIEIYLGINVITLALAPRLLDPEALDMDLSLFADVSALSALLFLILASVVAAICLAVIRSRVVRVWIQQHIVRRDAGQKKQKRYNPDSWVHTTAIVLALFIWLFTFAEFVLTGGIEGLAENLQFNTPTTGLLFATMIIYVLIALLGVGFWIRRDSDNALQRLGLRMPEVEDWRIGLAAGFGLFLFQAAVVGIWTLIASPETFAEQTAASEQLFTAFSGSIFAGFALALTAAIGEEILFRGALQPVFGLLLTSIFFALLHTQYTLTPASFVIFGVALGLGWLRQRFTTTTAIIAHFVYNFIPFVLFWLFSFMPEAEQAAHLLIGA